MPSSKPKSSALVVYSPAAQSGPKQKASKTKKNRPPSQAFPPHVSLSVDPWNSPLEGAGRPDFNSEPTIPWRESWSQTFTTDASGNLFLEMMGTLANCVYTKALTLVADPVIGAATNQPLPNLSSLQSTFTNYRPLAIAFEAEYIGEAQLCKGVLGVGRITADLAGTETFSQLTDETYYKETYASNKVAARMVFSENDFVSNSTTSHAGKIFLLASGLPATLACVRIRFTACYEMQVGHTSLLSRDTSHTVSHPAQLATVASIIGPAATLATGEDPVGQLIAHGHKLVQTAGAVNGLWKSAKPLATLLAEYASLLL